MNTEPRYVSVWVVTYNVFQDAQEIVGIYTTQPAALAAAQELNKSLSSNDLKHIWYEANEHKLLT